MISESNDEQNEGVTCFKLKIHLSRACSYRKMTTENKTALGEVDIHE